MPTLSKQQHKNQKACKIKITFKRCFVGKDVKAVVPPPSKLQLYQYNFATCRCLILVGQCVLRDKSISIFRLWMTHRVICIETMSETIGYVKMLWLTGTTRLKISFLQTSQLSVNAAWVCSLYLTWQKFPFPHVFLASTYEAIIIECDREGRSHLRWEAPWCFMGFLWYTAGFFIPKHGKRLWLRTFERAWFVFEVGGRLESSSTPERQHRRLRAKM